MTLSQGRLKRRLLAGARILVDYPRRIFTKISLSAVVIDSQVNRGTALDSRVRFYRSEIGRYSHIARGTFVESTSIGAFCSIGGACCIGGGAHPLMSVSTSPVFHSGGNILGTVFSPIEYNPFERTIIENDVWIGNGVRVKSGVRILTGAVVGMGSVLTKDVGPYEIWAGNPARMIRKRFDERIIDILLESEWWLYSDDQRISIAELFGSPEAFIEEVMA